MVFIPNRLKINQLWTQCLRIIGNFQIIQLYQFLVIDPNLPQFISKTSIILFTMSSHQTFLPNSTNRNPKDHNYEFHDNSTECTIDPIHSGSQIQFLSIKHKISPPKPAFGTSASRVINELKGNKQSDIVAYSRINYKKDQKYQDRYQQVKIKLTPFLSSSVRFNQNRANKNGPGQYAIPQIFKLNQQNSLKQGPMFCPFKRWQTQQNKSSAPNGRFQEKIDISPPSYKENQSSINSFEIQRKIKQKRQQVKLKMLNLKQKMKRHNKYQHSIMQRMGFSQNEGKTSQVIQSPKRVPQQALTSPTKTINLRQITSEYLPKLHYEFERQEYQTVGQIKNFKQKYNHMPVFAAKNYSPFSSYIPKNDVPGPGYYEKKVNKMKKRRESSKMDQFLL